jgi:MFS superfamily sulfate permease-like transporter
MASSHAASANESKSPLPGGEVPRGNADGFRRYLRHDVLAGFMVFLIALPLCLGISLASGYPPLAGLFTAIIGSILTTFISNSELTIKGPAAGLIVIAIGCIADFGGDGMIDGFSEADAIAYRSALAVGVAAAVLQIICSVLRAGILGEFFPKAAIHGMLAAIGVIIIAKQIPVALGVTAKGEPLHLLAHIPQYIREANPAIACIGIVSLLLIFTWPALRKRIPGASKIPPQLVVLVVSIVMGIGFNLLHEHSYQLQGHEYQLGEQFLVSMPKQVFGMFKELTLPRFEALAEPKAWKWVAMFFIIGTLESILSAKAVDTLDPWKRKSNMDRDCLAVGIANLCSAMVGGLPMISEIVRSKANIDNGARTRFADMWHGVFLLLCVSLIPGVLHMIPLAALAAMLVYTGFRLAHPSEFVHVYHIGREQLIIFVVTLIATLATDLLIGITIGIAVKFFIHFINGMPLRSMFKPFLEVQKVNEDTCLITARESAVFSNWIPFKRQLEDLLLVERQNVILDVSDTKLIDHTVMEKLHELRQDMAAEDVNFEIIGLESLRPLAQHDQAARRRGMMRMRRITVVADKALEDQLEREFFARGASELTIDDCRVRGGDQSAKSVGQIRLEAIVPFDVCDDILDFLRNDLSPEYQVKIALELAEVVIPRRVPIKASPA